MKRRWQSFLTLLKILLTKPKLLLKLLDDDVVWQAHLNRNHPKFAAGLPWISWTQLMGDEECVLMPLLFSGGGSTPMDYALLQKMAMRPSVSSYFEIGTWRGESAVMVSPHVAEVICLDLPESALRAMGCNDWYIQEQGALVREDPKVKWIREDSAKFDFSGLNRHFDLIFIDGDHHYNAVKNDTQKCFEHLVHSNTIVIWHDYAYHPEKIRPSVLAGILDGLPNSIDKNRLYHVAHSLSAIYYPEDIDVKQPELLGKGRTHFSVKIKPIQNRTSAAEF